MSALIVCPFNLMIELLPLNGYLVSDSVLVKEFATENAQVTGTITVDSGVTLTVNSGGRLVIS